MTTNVYKLAPAGIDLSARQAWARMRRTGRHVRGVIIGFAADYSFSPEHFDAATGAYVEKLADVFEGHPKQALILRLARAYVAKYRRQLIADLVLMRMAARQFLLGGKSLCQISA
jgi:hypothetical protein